MTTTTRNEAAERLRTWLGGRTAPSRDQIENLDAALAAAYEEGHAAARRDWVLAERDTRRATVERIQRRLSAIPSDADYPLDLVDAILDEEADR